MTATHEHELLAERLTKKKCCRIKRGHGRWKISTAGCGTGGEEFLHILTRAVVLSTEHNEPVEMRRGDSAYCDGTIGHNVISTSAGDATIILVTSLG